MNIPANKSQRKNVASIILTDIHFWIPAAVLLGGLWVLHWIR